MDEREKRARFEAAALPWSGPLHALALRLTDDPGQAMDLVQETYLRAFGSFDRFVPGSSSKAWLLEILYSTFIGEVERGQRGPAELAPDDLERSYEAALAAEGAATAQAFPAVEVETAIRQLPQPLRSAVLLVDVEDLSYEEAAAVLDCPVIRLRTRLFRARKALFAVLSGHALQAGRHPESKKA